MNGRLPKILIGQTNSSITGEFKELFSEGRFSIEIADFGDRILSLMENGHPPDLLLMDDSLQDPDALQICRTVKANPDLSMIPILLSARANDPTFQEEAIEAGCDDILFEPVIAHVLLARMVSLLRIKSLTDELDNAENVLYTLARTIEAKDRYTLGHADRVAGYALELGRKLGVGADELRVLRKGAMLHDVGKLAIPDDVLSKPGKYTPEEFDVMKQHPVLGCEICEKLYDCVEANDPNYAQNAQALVDLLGRHARTVMTVMEEQVARAAKDITRETLPSTCLTRLLAGSAITDNAPQQDNVFKKDGDFWTVKFGGKYSIVRASRGMDLDCPASS